MNNYMKCGNGIEKVEIYSDSNARLQCYLADDNEIVKIYNVCGAN